MHYEDLENLPFRASMRRSTKTGYWHDTYGSKIREFYVWLYAFLRSSIGKSFNDAYSALCKKYPNNIGWLSPKDQFKWRFDDGPGYRRYGYYVDEDGMIRYKRLRQPRKISITVPTAKARSTYRFKSHHGFIGDILWILPYSRRTIVEVTGRITFDEYIQIRNSSYWGKAKLFLEEMDDSEYEIAWKGCRRYSQLRAEKNSKERKAQREYKKRQRKQLEEDCSGSLGVTKSEPRKCKDWPEQLKREKNYRT